MSACNDCMPPFSSDVYSRLTSPCPGQKAPAPRLQTPAHGIRKKSARPKTVNGPPSSRPSAGVLVAESSRLEAENGVLNLGDGARCRPVERVEVLLHSGDHRRRACGPRKVPHGKVSSPLDLNHTRTLEGNRGRWGSAPQRRALWSSACAGRCSSIISLVTKPTPPVQPSGGLFRT